MSIPPMAVYYSNDCLYQNYFSVLSLLDNCILVVYNMKVVIICFWVIYTMLLGL